MGIYKEDISDKSEWITATPNESAKKLPFYITEMGHFFANGSYVTERKFHESCLFLYTVSGSGTVISDGIQTELPPKCAFVLDCRKPHKYMSSSEAWEFIWFHFNGTAAFSTAEIISRSGNVQNAGGAEFKKALLEIADKAADVSLSNSFALSLDIHRILNDVFNGNIADNRELSCDIGVKAAAEFIEQNFSDRITIDDILAHAHMSKYYFIRSFHKIMGTAPYSYITDCRVNSAKILLRTTDNTVAEISEMCGFADTSNFIAHFKKRVGETPLQYRHDFRSTR